ncbi:MAG: tRNA (N6-isopentenyl adenosine(37)-C2)-methylthiotransferase MiaB [Alphaproteobacteria bacterium]|jgi:tRNA-2-methylthio-N6-dimethylallyladenosine synthase|nr:tRNA (N6-isopentenyl adenosine(37)-C2)-methylthiotransferase MiaB [Alphaproteobacteria bacterium]MBT5389527.1 tRNA (N6-isopentenyl adenosine(37)-C2)-methylthiotransferase MiaB [Alphaproteobacteria bacterium]MBT5540825.1 tRNA (N6-isopentenyl adenosine(37)-C2)-methylthiotransferase MiaB [Alphaproteobacteria bacterium]
MPEEKLPQLSTKSVFIKTYGCQMNVYDSQKMSDVLAPHGYVKTNVQEEADLIILNTCHIREKASEKVFSELGRLKILKAKRANMGDKVVLAVAGCTAQAEGKEITARAPYVDMVFGPQTYHELPKMLEELKRKQISQSDNSPTHIVNTNFPVEPKFDELPDSKNSEGPSGFVSIQEGCDKFCTFCVVPYTRGAEYSRPVEDIVHDIRHLVSIGVQEITLLGQNVNAYHGQAPHGKVEWGLGRLAMAIAESVPNLKRLRYTTSHPRDVDDALIEAHRDIDVLMPFIHLPVQSGSDAILKKMNRKHSADEYRVIIDRFRDMCPNIAFSSDFIVGFPGETDEDFAATLQLVQDIDYAQAYSFKYSIRPGTPGSTMENQVSESVKSERLQALQQLLNAQQIRFNKLTVGKTLPVLFEKKGKHKDQYVGKTPYLQSVQVECPRDLTGSLLDVFIKIAHANSMTGEIHNYR